MASEADIQRQIMLALSEADCTIWRQNTGLAWVGDAVMLANGDVLLKKPRRLHVGLCNGSSDLIGIMPDGRFLAVEVKSKTGRVSIDQDRFIEVVKQRGGVAGVCRSKEDAIKLIR